MHANLSAEDAATFRAAARRAAEAPPGTVDPAPLLPFLAFCLAQRGTELDRSVPVSLAPLPCAHGAGVVATQGALAVRVRVTDAGALEVRWDTGARRRVRRAA